MFHRPGCESAAKISAKDLVEYATRDDAKRSAQAVRQILDKAAAEFGDAAQRGETGLKAPERVGRLGIA